MAAILRVDQIQNTNGQPASPATLNMDVSGMPLQMVAGRNSDVIRVTSVAANTFYQISQFNIAITPKVTNSRIHMQWVFYCDSNENMGFRVYRNGALAPYGVNAQQSARYGTYAIHPYDQNQSSTPALIVVNYFDEPATTATQTYGLAIHSTNGNAYSFCINRTWDGAALGQDSYEMTVGSWQAIEYLL